jgi:hypothetical protein
VAVETVTDLITHTAIMLAGQDFLVDHNHHHITSQTILIGINLTLHGDLAVMDQETVTEEREVAKVLA